MTDSDSGARLASQQMLDELRAMVLRLERIAEDASFAANRARLDALELEISEAKSGLL